jgi:hypothetical protein
MMMGGQDGGYGHALCIGCINHLAGLHRIHCSRFSGALIDDPAELWEAGIVRFSHPSQAALLRKRVLLGGANQKHAAKLKVRIRMWQ